VNPREAFLEPATTQPPLGGIITTANAGFLPVKKNQIHLISFTVLHKEPLISEQNVLLSLGDKLNSICPIK